MKPHIVWKIESYGSAGKVTGTISKSSNGSLIINGPSDSFSPCFADLRHTSSLFSLLESAVSVTPDSEPHQPPEESIGPETQSIRALIECAISRNKVAILSFQQIVHICWNQGLLSWYISGKTAYHKDVGGTTLILNDQANARVGLLLQRYCSGENGEIHEIPTNEGGTRNVRLSCHGRGRNRKFRFEEMTPQFCTTVILKS